MSASKILGIIGICTGWLIPLVGLVLGIIGLSIKKEKGHEKRDKTLNIVSIAIAFVFWMFYLLLAIFA